MPLALRRGVRRMASLASQSICKASSWPYASDVVFSSYRAKIAKIAKMAQNLAAQALQAPAQIFAKIRKKRAIIAQTPTPRAFLAHLKKSSKNSAGRAGRRVYFCYFSCDTPPMLAITALRVFLLHFCSILLLSALSPKPIAAAVFQLFLLFLLFLLIGV
jgi:hypothetical protein